MAKKNKPKSSQLMKFFAWSGLGLLIGGGLAGTGYGIANFVKSGSQQKGTTFTNSLESIINVGVDQNKTDNENMSLVQNIADKISNEVQQFGVNEIDIKSGLKYLDLSSSSSKLLYGTINVLTEQNIPNFTIDFDADNFADIALAKLKLYYLLANQNSYYLQNINLDNGETVVHPDDVFDKIYLLNNHKTQAKRSDSKLEISLRDKQNEIVSWNFNQMQEQFTEVYKWNGEEDRSKVVENGNASGDQKPEGESDSSTPVTKTQPKQSLIFWNNRTGLINKLQILATVAYLNRNKGSLLEETNAANPNLDPYKNQATIIKNIYDKLSSNTNDKLFMEWIAKDNNNYFLQMPLLLQANNQSFGLADNVSRDPLLSVLHDFYTSPIYSNSEGAIAFNSQGWDFLYSWNISQLGLLSSYVKTIDYNNWFTFFSDDTDSKDVEVKKKEFKTNNFSQTISTSTIALNNLVDLLNNSSFQSPVIIPQFIEPINSNIKNPKNIYLSLVDFLNNNISLFPQTLSNSVTSLSAFNGAMIGISALLLLIGIVVSILYRVPGLWGSICSFISFGFSLLISTSLSIVFGMGSYLSIVVSVFISFLPFINSQIGMRNAIKYKRLNIYNAFIYSLNKYIKSAIATFASVAIIALTAMFFGKYQINQMGSSLIITVLANIIGNVFVFLIGYGLIYYLMIRKSARCAFGHEYLLILKSIKTRGAFKVRITDNSLIDHWLSMVNLKTFKIRWYILLIPGAIGILAIVGGVLIATIGINGVNTFNSAQQISITFNPQDISNINRLFDQMSQQLGLNISSQSIINNVFFDQNGNQWHEMIILLKSPVDINEFMNWVKMNAGQYISHISLALSNGYLSQILFVNAIHVILISLGFLTILSIVFTNIINLFPIFVVSLINVFGMLGFSALIRMPFDLNSLFVWLMMFCLSQVMIYNLYNDFRFDYDKKHCLSKKLIYHYVAKQMKHAWKFYGFMTAMIMAGSLFLMVFNSQDFVANLGLITINIIIIFIFNTILVPWLFILMMRLRAKYVHKVETNKLSKTNKKVYDKIDEQPIMGINLH